MYPAIMEKMVSGLFTPVVFNLSDSAGHINNFNDARGPQSYTAAFRTVCCFPDTQRTTCILYVTMQSIYFYRILCIQRAGLPSVVIFSKRQRAAGHALKTPDLHQLQQRRKWTNKSNNIHPGTVVLLKDANTPPLQWKLGVAEKVHYGDDELVRVADVRTQSRIFRRAVHKLCPLPVDTE
jgi:hypothetical protein